MKKLLVSFFLLLISTVMIGAQELVIAMSDFTVESRNPAYEFLGKGISRLVASELRKSGRIKLVERERMNKLLAEQAFSLSDLADASKQVRIGQMLSANYLVMGEIIDMGAAGLLVSVRMVKVETGEVAWQDEKQEKLAVYDYMGAYFAKSLLGSLNVSANQATIAKIEKKEEKAPESIIKTSEGIDAYDRQDTETAKTVLEQAKALDPANEVAVEYLAKLVTNTTKFKIQMEPYFSYQNPAFLGIIRTDRFNLSASTDFQNELGAGGGSYEQGFLPVPGYSGMAYGEQTKIIDLGYCFPIGENWGAGLELFYSLVTNEIESGGSWVRSRREPKGGTVNVGCALSDRISVGLGISVFTEHGFNSDTFGTVSYRTDFPPVSFAGNLGFLYRNGDETFIYDTRVGYSTATTDIFDLNSLTIARVIGVPLFWENTLTFAFNGKNTFLVLKQLNNLSLGQTRYFGSLMPVIEHYFFRWFSARLGAEGSFTLLNDLPTWGWGVMGGITFRVPDWGLDISCNVSYRPIPARAVENMMIPYVILFIDINLSGVFITRQPAK